MSGMPQAERAPAKINLALHVVGRRPDGYHLIETLAVFTRFGDKLSVVPADEADAVAVSGPFAAQVPAGMDNLVSLARDALRAEIGAGAGPVEIALEKNLPVLAGVGGGSADAAAALRALARVWNADPGASRLAELGAALGADLPMCLASRPVLATGVGETIRTIEGLPTLFLVLVNPGVPIATPDVFAALRSRENAPLPPLPGTIDGPGLHAWLAGTRNDLEEPARTLEPIVDDALQALRAHGATFARMSGSGATCFGLFADLEAAQHAAAAIRRERPAWFAVATQTNH